MDALHPMYLRAMWLWHHVNRWQYRTDKFLSRKQAPLPPDLYFRIIIDVSPRFVRLLLQNLQQKKLTSQIQREENFTP